MLIIDFDKAINLDRVNNFYVDLNDDWRIVFEYNSENYYDYIDRFKTQEEALEVFNDIIANYNSGKKIYEIG